MIDWQRVDVVLLDMDGTLLDLHYDNYFWSRHLPARYAELKSATADQANSRIDELVEQHRGSLNWYCLDFWSRELALDIVPLKREVADRVQMRPGAADFLSALRQSGRTPWLVTNAHRDSVLVKMERENIEPCFDRMILSHDFAAAKEHQAFWQRMMAQHPFDPARALLIDDSAAVLEAAAEFGIGQLLTIAQPDSQQPARDALHHPVLHDFAQIMPIPALKPAA